MRKSFKVGLIIALILLIIGTLGIYVSTTPQYKTIELNGYSFEVPQTNNSI